jgi:ParB-like chromosome segregation protein Spo0J
MSYTHTIVPIDQIRPHPRNARTHSKKQIQQIAVSIRALGFAAPVLIDEDKVLIAGHGRLEAAKSLGNVVHSGDNHLWA